VINLKNRNFKDVRLSFRAQRGISLEGITAEEILRFAQDDRTSRQVQSPRSAGTNLNCVFFTLLCFLALSCILGKALGATNEVVDALPPAAQASAVAPSVVQRTMEGGQGAMADESPEATQASPIQRGEQGERDPFWPIGYVPPSKPGRTVTPAKTNGAEFVKETTSQVPSLSGMLKIGGVIRSGGKFYATINGFTVQTGEVVTVVAEGEVYKFVVEMIDFKKVQIKPLK